MTAFCANCGKEVREDAKFCGECGARIEVCSDSSMVKNNQYLEYDKHENKLKTIKKYINNLNLDNSFINRIRQKFSRKFIYDKFLKQEGRLGRFAYFKLQFIIYLVSFTLGHVGGYISRINEWKTFLVVYTVILTSIFIVPTYSVMVRRLHDLSKDRTLAIIYNLVTLLVTFHYIFTTIGSYEFFEINALYFFLWVCWYFECVIGLHLFFAKGTKGDNQYGEDPLNMNK